MNVDKIIDGVIHYGRIIHLTDAISKKREQLRSVTSNTCGNCSKWMTKSCEKEQKTKRIMSINDSCAEFNFHDQGGLKQKFTKELLDLELQLKTIVKKEPHK